MRYVHLILIIFISTEIAVHAKEIRLEKGYVQETASVEPGHIRMRKQNIDFAGALALFGVGMHIMGINQDAAWLGYMPVAGGINKIYLSKVSDKYDNVKEDYSTYWSYYFAFAEIGLGVVSIIARSSIDDPYITSQASLMDAGCVFLIAGGILNLIEIKSGKHSTHITLGMPYGRPGVTVCGCF